MKKILLGLIVLLLCSFTFSLSSSSVFYLEDANTLGAVASTVDANTIDANSADANIVVEPQIVLNARADIAAGEVAIKKVADANIPTERLSDLLLIAKNSLDESLDKAVLYDAPVNLSTFNQKMSEFLRVSALAFNAHDELLALRERINRAQKDVKDLTSVESIYLQAQSELNDQRFERVMDLIQKADDEIVNLTSLGTRAEVIYDAAASNIYSIINKYWLEIGLVIFIPLILFLVFRIQIRHMRLRAKIDSLTMEKNVLLEEIKKAQSEYFVKGAIADGVYTTKVNVFSGMIRDLTKEIALLKEQEEKINTSKAMNNFVKNRKKK